MKYYKIGLTTKKDDWNPNLYDNKHALVSELGKGVIKLSAPKKGEKILDLGRGSDDLANLLIRYCVDVKEIDNSENVIAQVCSKY